MIKPKVYHIISKWTGSCKHVADALSVFLLIKAVHLVGLLHSVV